MRCLLKQKETREDVSKAFKVVQEVKDRLGPLATALCSDALKLEKKEQKPQLTAVKEEL